MDGQQMTTPNDVAAVVAAAPADTTVQVINLWALVLLTFTNLGSTLWSIFNGPARRNATELKAHCDELIAIARRVAALEDAGKDAPKQKDFHDLELKLSETMGVIGLLSERLKPLEKVTERLQEWAMEQKR